MSKDAGSLPDNIVYFARALRRASVPVGTSQILDALRAVQKVGFTKRRDFHSVLRAMIVSRKENLLVFDQVFAMFWRDPEFLENLITNLLPVITAPSIERPLAPAQNRAAEAMAGGGGQPREAPLSEQLELEAQFSQSSIEKLSSKDFESMSNAEIKDSERAIRNIKLKVPKLLGRRYAQSQQGERIDIRKALQIARRNGGIVANLPKKRTTPRKLNLVILCDISGSMTTYSRMMMHFMHSMVQSKSKPWAQVHSFTFGTELCITFPLIFNILKRRCILLGYKCAIGKVALALEAALVPSTVNGLGACFLHLRQCFWLLMALNGMEFLNCKLKLKGWLFKLDI